MALRAFGNRILVLPDPKPSKQETLQNGLVVVRDNPSNIMSGHVIDVGDGEIWKNPPTSSVKLEIGTKVWYRGPNQMFGPAAIKLDKDNEVVVLAPEEILAYIQTSPRINETEEAESVTAEVVDAGEIESSKSIFPVVETGTDSAHPEELLVAS